MAPNKRGGPPSASVVPDGEVAARGAGTPEAEGTDSYDGSAGAELRVFFTGMMFLTRLPVPAGTDHHPTYLMRSTVYFPIIGAAVGLWGAAFYNAAAALWPPHVAAAAATLATVWLTGCFHEDGLADCIDGFGGGWGRAQILRIMRDSRIGTYALVGVALLLQVKVGALAALPAPATALVVAHSVSRWPSLPMLHWCKYIEDDEFAKGAMYNWMARVQTLITRRRLLVGTLASAALPCALLGARGAALVCGVVACVTAAAMAYGNAIIGGVVGDYIGATIQVAEVAVYLALAADWGALFGGQQTGGGGGSGAGAWRHFAVLAAVAFVPVMWTRQIVDFAC